MRLRNVIFFISAGFIFTGCFAHGKVVDNQICYQKHCFTVEVVQKQEELQKGLMFRKSLGENKGMLFIFSDSEPHSFWMKNTLIPLDMIWIDYAQRVVDIIPNVPPCKSDPCPVYTPKGSALYVLEINAEAAQKAQMAVGERLDFHLSGY